MPVALSDLLVPLTTQQVETSVLNAMVALGFPVTSWEVDGIARNIIHEISVTIAGFSTVAPKIVAGGYLDLAEALDDPSWLRLLAQYGYGVDYIQARTASGDYDLVNTSGLTYVINAGDLRVSGTEGQTYTNVDDGIVLAASPVTITIRAEKAGTVGSAAANTITNFVTPLSGVTGTNPSPLVGLDDETAKSLAQRCRDKLAILSPSGGRAAFRFFAIISTDDPTPPAGANGSLIGVTRVGFEDTSGNGTVIVYVANASGPLSGGEATEVLDFLRFYCVPDSVTVDVQPATSLVIDVTADVYTTDASLTSADLELAVAEYFSGVPVGGVDIGSPVVPKSGIMGALGTGRGVVDVLCTVPAADTVVSNTSDIPVLGVATLTLHVVTV